MRTLATLALAAALAAAATVAVASPTGREVVVIDPGHDERANLEREPIGPGSKETKIKDGGGTSGVVTRTPEAVVNLAIAKRLRTLLGRAGVDVVMTRTATAGVSMGNIARARIANEAGAALFLRIHADGSTDHSIRGTHTLVPALRRGWTDDIYEESARAGRIVQDSLVRRLRSRDGGLTERSDLTGFNWSDVPTVLVEVGYLTNPGEDRLLGTDAYRRKAARGLCEGVLRYLGLPVRCALEEG
jgi:N-acetylmuramoyl-L-alanine amidase